MAQQLKSNKVAENYSEVWKNIGVRCKPLPKEEQKPIYDFFKRTFDITASLCALILLWWVIAIAAIAVKIEDGGPAFYSQTRVSKNGKLFKMYKLRSMYVDADARKKALLEQNEMDGPVFKMENDPRITKTGAWLRKMSIDELPQLFNCLEGTMSIVGPRPPLGYEVMQYDEYAMRRLSVKPGLTCYWQCSGRSDIDFDQWMELDNKYIDDRGMWTDIKMIFKTIWLRDQRKKYRDHVLTGSQTAKLEAIGIKWKTIDDKRQQGSRYLSGFYKEQLGQIGAV